MSNDIEHQRITVPPLSSAHEDPDLALVARRTISIQEAPGRQSARIPVEFRTMSLQLETPGGNAEPANNGKNAVKGTLASLHSNLRVSPPLFVDLADLDWHHVSIDEALRRLGVSPKTGIDASQVQRRASQYGPNQISPPPSRVFRKVVGWVFGGFGSLLLAASVVCLATDECVQCAGNHWANRTPKRPT